MYEEGFKTRTVIVGDRGSTNMDVRPPEVGLPIDRAYVFIITLNQALVRKFSARPVTIKFLLDSQQVDKIDGHLEAEYELRDEGSLDIYCKMLDDSVVVKVSHDGEQSNYSLVLGEFVDEDLVAAPISVYESLVRQWMSE